MNFVEPQESGARSDDLEDDMGVSKDRGDDIIVDGTVEYIEGRLEEKGSLPPEVKREIRESLSSIIRKALAACLY
jgi:hypothetical protein